MKWRSEAGLRSFAVGASRKLLAEVKPIFSLVAYRRIAKFPDNQTKRADNSYEESKTQIAMLRQGIYDYQN